MRFFHAALSVFNLLSVSQSAPVTSCDNLIQPFEDNGGERFLGKWFHVAESSSNQAAEVLTKRFRESFWFKFTAANETGVVNVEVSSKMFGFCLTATFQMALVNNTLRQSQFVVVNVPETSSNGNEEAIAETTGEEEPEKMLKLLKTGCSGCLLIEPPDVKFGGTSLLKSLMLLSKTGTVTAAELNEFKKQSECLDLRQPFSLDPKGDVCPELPPQDTEFTDHPRRFVDGQETTLQNFINSIVNAAGGPENLKKMVEEINTSIKNNSSDHEDVRAAH